MLSDINISHGSVATPLRCGGICNDDSIANFLLNANVKELWKSVIIWRSYGQEFGVLFLWTTVYIDVYIVYIDVMYSSLR